MGVNLDKSWQQADGMGSGGAKDHGDVGRSDVCGMVVACHNLQLPSGSTNSDPLRFLLTGPRIA